MGFFDVVGDAGKRFGEGVVNANPILNSVYQSWRNRNKQQTDPNADPNANTDPRASLQSANEAAGLKDLSSPAAGQDAASTGMPDAATMAAQSQWNQPYDSKGGSGIANLAGMFMGFEHGTVVTKPTIARLAEHEPEIVIPLNHNPNNRVQTDLLSQYRYR